MERSVEEQARLERWMSQDATSERKKIWRAYNDVMNASGIIKRMAVESEFITEAERGLLIEWADKLFWEPVTLAGIVEGAVDAAVMMNGNV